MAQNDPYKTTETDTGSIGDKPDDKTTDDITDSKTVPEWEQFLVVVDKLIKFTKDGYKKEPIEVSKILLEKNYQ